MRFQRGADLVLSLWCLVGGAAISEPRVRTRLSRRALSQFIPRLMEGNPLENIPFPPRPPTVARRRPGKLHTDAIRASASLWLGGRVWVAYFQVILLFLGGGLRLTTFPGRPWS